jgi:hypothetical protein
MLIITVSRTRKTWFLFMAISWRGHEVLPWGVSAGTLVEASASDELEGCSVEDMVDQGVDRV